MTKSLNVLVLEDDDLDFELFFFQAKKILAADVDFLFSRVATLADFTRTVEEADWDVAVVDLNLPDSTGLATLEHVISTAPDLSVVVLTSLSDPENGVRAVSLGAQDYLDKDELNPHAIRRALTFAIERQRLLRQLGQKREEVFAAKMTASVGRLAEGIAHEVNNSLMKVKGLAELHGDSETSSDLANDLQMVIQEVDEASILVQKLLQAGGREDVILEVVDASALVAGTMLYLQKKVPSGVKLTSKIQPDLMVIGGELQLHQIVENCVMNAFEAMPEGGEVTVSLQPTLDGTELTISDTGIGLGKLGLHEICEPFFTTKSPGSHDGLGLSVVSGVLQQCEGSLEVRRSNSKTEFRIWFPKASAPEEPVYQSPQRKVDYKDLVMLIVDDEPIIRRILLSHFKKLGATCYQAGDGVEGMSQFELLGDQINVVISDIVMPAMDGKEMLRRMKTIRPNLPCVFITATSKGILNEETIGGIPVPIVRKPFSMDEIQRTVLDLYCRNRDLTPS